MGTADGATGHEMVPLPDHGRRFTAERRVRWGDTDRFRRLRLDAAARYLQDVANDDTRDVGLDPGAPWLVRRTVFEVVAPIRLGEVVTLTTFSGGFGSRWAERRTSLVGSGGGHMEAASLWVFVNPVTGRPARLSAEFHATYDEAAGGRTVSARLRHGPPPDDAMSRPWPLRATDLDGLAHVNNAATWSAVEEELARLHLAPTWAALEYPDAIDPDDVVTLLTDLRTDAGSAGEGDLDPVRADRVEPSDRACELSVWLTVHSQVRAAAMIRARPAPVQT